MSAKHILVVDDHGLILEGFSKLLQNMPSVADVTIFTEGLAVCKVIRTNQYDIYIIDLKLSDIDGFELINRIRAQHPEARIIVCTMNEDVWIINRLLHINIDGIVFKSSSVEHIVKAVTAVLAGGKYYCPRYLHLKKRFESHRKKSSTRVVNLTVREQEVLTYIIRGMTTREIAEKMCVSDNGVEGFRKNLFEKTGVRNVAQLVAYAYEHNLAKK